MSNSGYKIRNQSGVHFITFAVVEWVDIFTRTDYQEIIIESLKHCQDRKDLIIYSWCLMSNHIHLIVAAKKANLSDILRDFKSYTSKKIVERISGNPNESRKGWMLDIFRNAGANNISNTTYQLWRQDNHPKEIFTEKFGNRKLTYIHNNPVKAGIVEKAEDYLLSSARDYYLDIGGLIKIDYI